ncbi:hypothetical protein HAX54_049678 [Datura stramonium]|uniref:Tail fiber assembly protein n=1 Tax=Datura stramonium TaxID=4076 RepID=A0ABS8SWY2_DATST|nr:hypothetical protein [Datura stramonium]
MARPMGALETPNTVLWMENNTDTTHATYKEGGIPAKSGNTIGDMNDQTEMWEAKMQYLEEMDLNNMIEQSIQDLNIGHAEYVYWLSRQESLLKQKAKIRWFEEVIETPSISRWELIQV